MCENCVQEALRERPYVGGSELEAVCRRLCPGQPRRRAKPDIARKTKRILRQKRRTMHSKSKGSPTMLKMGAQITRRTRATDVERKRRLKGKRRHVISFQAKLPSQCAKKQRRCKSSAQSARMILGHIRKAKIEAKRGRRVCRR